MGLICHAEKVRREHGFAVNGKWRGLTFLARLLILILRKRLYAKSELMVRRLQVRFDRMIFVATYVFLIFTAMWSRLGVL